MPDKETSKVDVVRYLETSKTGHGNLQLDEPTLSVCTRPSSTRDWRTSFTDCETAIIHDAETRIYSAFFIIKGMHLDQIREGRIGTSDDGMYMERAMCLKEGVRTSGWAGKTAAVYGANRAESRISHSPMPFIFGPNFSSSFS